MFKNNGVLTQVHDKDLSLLKENPKEFWKDVKVIGRYAFAGENIVDLTIPEGVERIEEFAFDECKNLEKVTFPQSLKRIGTLAFHWCSKLEKVVIPPNVEEVGWGAFYMCFGLKDIYISSEKTKINQRSFDFSVWAKKIHINSHNLEKYRFLFWKKAELCYWDGIDQADEEEIEFN